MASLDRCFDPFKAIHRKFRRRPSCWNLQRRVADYSRSAIFVWHSSGSGLNRRGAVMVYQVDGEEVATWCASLRESEEWRLEKTKGISRESFRALAAGAAGDQAE